MLLVAESLLPLLGIGWWSAAFHNRSSLQSAAAGWWLLLVLAGPRWSLLDCISGSLMVLGARMVLAGSCQMGWCGWLVLRWMLTDHGSLAVVCKLVGCFVGAFGGQLDGVRMC